MLESNPLPSPTISAIEQPASQEADVLVAGLTEDGQLTPSLAEVNESSNGWLQRLIGLEQVRGKKGELTLLASPLESGPTMILVVGLGDGTLRRELALESASAAIRRLSDRQRERVVVSLGESFPEDMHDAIVAGCVLACEAQSIYQSEPSLEVPAAILMGGISDAAITRGSIIGHATNHTRRLVNEPPSVLYPETFAEKVARLAEDAGLAIEVWDEKRLEAEGCRAMLAVGAGSARPPRLVMLRHQGGAQGEAPIALVGKGVTFDSGGLSLKPSEGMEDMKCDMAGAATVVGVMFACAKLGIKKNVIGFCGLAENMVSGESYKLGDVIETRSGKTIEILNTDAEGRVVLADTLDVAVQHQPRSIVDLATLTGACVVALGYEVAGLMTNDQSVCDSIVESANAEGELVWQLPMFRLYDDKVKSQIADIKNVGEGRWGGAITAAKFLENFVDEVPWVHMDIAGPAFADGAKPHRDAGATGAMVRTLIRWVESS